MKNNRVNKKHDNIYESNEYIKKLIVNYRNYENDNQDNVFSNDVENSNTNDILNLRLTKVKEKKKKVKRVSKVIDKIKSFDLKKMPSSLIKNVRYKSLNLYNQITKKEYWLNLIDKFNNLFNKFKNFTKNKLTLKSAVLIVMFIIIGNSVFSWFYNEYTSKGTFFGIGNIKCQISQYDSSGSFVGNVDDIATLIHEDNMGVTSRNSQFVEIENIGSLNVDYNITFQLDGLVSDAGVMYYRFYDITDQVKACAITAQYDTKLKAYAADNQLPADVEFDSSFPVSNLSTIKDAIVKGTINLDPNFTENNKRYYRIDYGMYSTANSSLYANESLSVHTNIYVTQVGANIRNTLGGEIWPVENELQFRNAVTNAVSGDTIKLNSDITIDGSIDISRRISIDANGYKLKITGDLVYDFVEAGELIIDTKGLGQIDIDNRLYINTPKSKVHFIGENTSYDIYVGGLITLNGLQNEEEDGVLLDNVRIVKNKVGNIPADLTIMSNTRLTIAPRVDVGNIIAALNSTNIEILNNGNIVQVQLQNMRLLDSFTKPQIYIYNLNVIRGIEGGTSIVLPTNATPYKGPNNGNTLIVKGVASSDITVSGSTQFGQGDITYTDIVDSVSPIVGEDNSYIVYLRAADDTIRNLLIEYFTQANSADPMQDIAKIKKLVVYTVNANYMENTNFTFLKSSELPVLEYLDIANARVKDNTVVDRICANALSNKASLKTVILPKTVSEIGASAFENDKLGKIPSLQTEVFNFLTIPQTVTKIESNAFTGAKYVNFEGLNPPEIQSSAFDNTDTGARYFVPENSLGLYQSASNIGSAYVHRTANLADSRNYFVYNTVGGFGISLFISEISVGTMLTVPGTIAYNNQQYTVNELGFASFRDIINPTGGTMIVIPDTVKSLKDYAFYGKNITSINLQNVTSVGNYTFYNTKLNDLYADNMTSIGDSAFEGVTLQYVTLDNVINIGNNAFKGNINLFEINLGKVQSLGDKALYNCPQLGRVYFKNITTKTVNNAETITLYVGDTSVFSEWGKYLDGRLRVYVPDGVSPGGNTYLSLYKNLFSANEQYIYTTGSIVGSYKHIALPYDFGEYTVREVNLTDYNNTSVNGWEIISYQGADLTSTYNLPTTLTVNGVTKNVVSIGSYAYRNSSVTLNNTVDLNNPNIVKIGDKAFYGLKINSINAPQVKTIGDYAFTSTKLTKAVFENLYSIGKEAFANLSTLYSLNVGQASVIGQNAIYNNVNLEQLFFGYRNTNNMQIDPINFSNIGINANRRFRIYVPSDSASLAFYKTLFATYSQYVYETGIIVGSYTNSPIPYDIGEYSIKTTVLQNANGESVDGWEIIEYHGQDLQPGYVFPSQFSIYSLSLNVISVGDNAFIHTTLNSGLSVDINSDNLLNIGDYAFKGSKGINSVIANSLVTLGDSAFEDSSLTIASFNNLNSIGQYALSNMLTLYSVNLGTVRTMGANALYNLDKLEQVFFDANTLNLSFNNTGITDIGTLTNDRLRIYVTDAISTNGQSYTDVYKNLFASEYRKYFFPRGTIIGSYSQVGIPLDIGSYSARKVTKKNASSNDVTGWELIEYHGDDISSSYALPNSLTINSETYNLISIGDNAFSLCKMVTGNSFAISNPNLLTIGNYAFNSLNGVSSIDAANVVTVGNYAFNYNKLQSVSLNNLSSAGDYAFAENSLLNYVNLGTITNLGSYLLADDSAIEQLIFTSTRGNGVSGTMNITIGNNAFLNACTQIGNRLRIYVPAENLSSNYTYVDAYKNTLPANFKNYIYEIGTIVGNYVYSPLTYDIGQYAVRSVTLNQIDNSTITGWKIIDYHGPALTSSYTIPTTFTINSQTMDVVAIGNYAYYNTEVIGSQTFNLTLSSSTVSIGDYAFTGKNVARITGNRVAYIGIHAFENCEYLTNVLFNGTKVIGDYAFNSDSRISSVILGDSVTSIGTFAFYNLYYGGVGGTLGPVTSFSISAMQAPSLGSSAFPLGFEQNKNRWIYNYTISIPTSATGYIDPPWHSEVLRRVNYTGTFSYNIINTNEIQITDYTGTDTNLIIPDTIDINGVPYNVTSIASTAFSNNTNITAITLPLYLNSVENGFLSNNSVIRTINVNASNTFFKSVSGVLFDKNGEYLIRYPNGNTATTYTLPTTTKVISTGAFSGATGLHVITLDAALSLIAPNCFESCSTLTTITFNSTTPPYLLGQKTFPANGSLSIRVPSASLITYQNRIYYYPYRGQIIGY